MPSFQIRDASGIVEKADGARSVDQGIEFDSTLNANPTTVRVFMNLGIARASEIWTYSFGLFPTLQMVTLGNQRTVTNGETNVGGNPRAVRSTTANFVAADLGMTIYCFSKFGGGLNFPTFIRQVVDAQNVIVAEDAAAAGGNTGLTLEIGRYRILRTGSDIGSGSYSETIRGGLAVATDTLAQTGDYFSCLESSNPGVRQKGIPIGASSGAGDIVTKGETDARFPNVAQIELFDAATNVASGANMGRIRIPANLNGFNLVAVGTGAMCEVASSGAMTIQVNRARAATPSTWTGMLSGQINLAAGGTDSSTATAPVVSTTAGAFDVATGDRISFTVGGTVTSAKGLWVTTAWVKP